MSTINAVIKFIDEKRNIIAQTSDAGLFSDLLKPTKETSLSVGGIFNLKFEDFEEDYEVINIDIYPYHSFMKGDIQEYMMENKSTNFNCEIIILLKRV